MPKEENRRFEEAPALFIEEMIKTYVAESSENRLFLIDDSPIWEEPLVGFANGEDPLFQEYKKIIGPFHLSPREILEQTLSITPGRSPKEIGDISVICWALPATKRTIASNARRDNWPSLRWSHTRYYGEILSNSLRRHVVSFLNQKGYAAVAPSVSPLFKPYPALLKSLNVDSLPVGRTSNWSERHALYAAGMGTFGLHDGLITAKGTAMRCGSVVVNLRLPPTPREYTLHNEYCPFFSDKSCAACIDRCPAGAITAHGHNKTQCDSYGHGHIAHLREWYDVPAFGCALCMTGVPCTSQIPPAASQVRGKKEAVH